MAEVIPPNEYDFTVSYRYLQAHNTTMYYYKPLWFNSRGKEYQSNKKELIFWITLDDSIRDNKTAITIVSKISTQKTNLRKQLPLELHKY